jgi:acetyl-CoA decarbonylase/synthase complex subunit beta
MQADGGWDRVVWMPADILERIREFIPAEILPKIATENEVSDLDELKTWLKEKQHPIVETWKEEEVTIEPSVPQVAPVSQPQTMAVPQTGFTFPTLELPPGSIPTAGLPPGMKITITLKNAKINAEKLIIKVHKE